jgi:Domain of unknown function (DUF4124)
MRTAHLLLLALAASGLSGTAAAADVWKWVDAKGVTHYSDQPGPGATKIEIRTGSVVESRPAAAPTDDSASDDSQADAGGYRNFQIVRPESNQVIINTGGQVDVEIRVSPPLQATHRLNLYVDGKAVTGFPRNTQVFALDGVPRGTHNVRAVITDASGNTIQESPSVEFNVRQESIAQPPTGPSLGQPPKPTPRPQQRATGNKMLTKQPSYQALNGGHPAIDPATNKPVVKKPAPKPGKP